MHHRLPNPHIGVAVLIIGILCVPCVYADGCFVGSEAVDNSLKPSSAAQKAILIEEGRDEVLLLQTTYSGPASRFAWIIPAPSRPRDIFAAEPSFLNQVFLHTEPQLATDISQPASWTAQMSMMAGITAPPGAASPQSGVTLLESLRVGEYRADVVAASDAGGLLRWLQTNHYAVPDQATAAFGTYVAKGWVFVALKLLDSVAKGQPTLTDVKPVGLRFTRPKQGLVFPLSISRLSAPPWSAISMVVIADEPQACRTLPSVWLPRPYRLSRGQTYGHLRRELTRKPRTALLCEYSARGALPYPDLSYRQDEWSRVINTRLPKRFATRFFGLVTPAEMQDLYFAAAPQPQERDYRLLISRRGVLAPGVVRQLAATRLTLPHSGRALLGPSRHKQIIGKPAVDRAVSGAALLWRARVWFLLAVIAIIISKLRGRRRFLASVVIVALAAGTVAVPHVVAGMGGNISYELVGELLGLVGEAEQEYCRDTGCHPQTVADLASSTKPAEGLDASGNRVPLGPGWRGPYLSFVPPDMLEGPGLLVDPLNCTLVDSGGYDLTVQRETGAARTARESKGLPSGPERFWSAVPEATARDVLGRYRDWLHGCGKHALATGTALGAPFHNGYVRPPVGTVIADLVTRRVWLQASDASAIGPGGRLLTGWYAGPTAPPVESRDQSGLSFVQATDARGSRLVTPSPLSDQIRKLAISSNGKLLAVDRGLWQGNKGLCMLTPEGRLGPVLARGNVRDMCFGPEGTRLYYLTGQMADSQLMSVPVGGGEARILRRGLGASLMQVTPRGVLVYCSTELGLVSHGGEWTSLVQVQGDLLAAHLFDDTLTFVTATRRSQNGRQDPNAEAPALRTHVLHLSSGKTEALYPLPQHYSDPPDSLTLLRVAEGKVTMFAQFSERLAAIVEVTAGGATAWRLEGTRIGPPNQRAFAFSWKPTGAMVRMTPATERAEQPLSLVNLMNQAKFKSGKPHPASPR